MAKINAGLLGGFSGKLGTMVGAIVKGQSTVRAYQKHVTNPKSARQMQVRDQFNQVWAFVRFWITEAYKKTNMLGYGIVGGMQFMAGQFMKKYDYMRMNPDDIALINSPWLRKTICNGVTFREDLLSQWTAGDGNHLLPRNIVVPISETPAFRYFGSDVPLSGHITIAYFDAYTDMQQEPRMQFYKTPYLLVEETPNEIGMPPIAGWQANKAACGFWNIIYKVDLAKNVIIELYNMDGVTNVNMNMGITGALPMESGNCNLQLGA